jgi:hypothetical protein
MCKRNDSSILISKIIRLRLPIIVSRGQSRRNEVFLDVKRLPELSDFDENELARIAKKLGPPTSSSITNKQEKIDYVHLSQEYQSLIDTGICANFAGVARHLNVSRAWISKVMRRGGSLKTILTDREARAIISSSPFSVAHPHHHQVHPFSYFFSLEVFDRRRLKPFLELCPSQLGPEHTGQLSLQIPQ